MTASTCADPQPQPAGMVQRAPLAELARYFACSAVAFGVDLGLYTVLPKLAGWDYAWAAALGFTAGLVVVYALSVRFVFRTRRLSDARSEFTVFAAIGAAGLLLTQALLWLLVDSLKAEPVVARVMTAGIVFLVNFTLRKLMLFSRGRDTGAMHV